MLRPKWLRFNIATCNITAEMRTQQDAPLCVVVSNCSAVGIGTMPRTVRPGVQIPVGATNISPLLNVQTSCGAPTPSGSSGTRNLSWEQSSRDMKLTTHPSLVSRLRMSGVVPLRPLYAFMAWVGKMLKRLIWTTL